MWRNADAMLRSQFEARVHVLGPARQLDRKNLGTKAAEALLGHRYRRLTVLSCPNTGRPKIHHVLQTLQLDRPVPRPVQP